MSRPRNLGGGPWYGTTGLAVGVALLLSSSAAAAERSNNADPAFSVLEEIVERAGAQSGLVVVLAEKDATLIDALARQEQFLVHGLASDPKRVPEARARLQSKGLYGRASVERWPDRGQLPYADDLVNVVVCDDGIVSEALLPEILRVMCPNGVAFVGTPGRDSPAWKRWKSALAAANVVGVEPVAGAGDWLSFEKPRPAGMDEWTHNRFRGPDGNPVSHDKLAGPPAQLRWLADPSWQRARGSPGASDRSPVFSGGRMYYVNIQATPATLGPMALIARDAHNGLLLWTRQVRPLRRAPRGLIAQPWGVFATLEDGGPYHHLDPASGETLRTYAELSDIVDVVFYDGLLIAATGEALLAVDARSGAVRWRRDDRCSKIIVADGRVFYKTRSALVCLDAAAGEVRWRNEHFQRGALEIFDRAAYGDGVLVWAGGNQLSGISAWDGTSLWTVKTPLSYVLFADGLFWATHGSHKTSRTTWLALEPKSGKTAAQIKPPAGYWTKGRCSLPMAMPGYVLGDSMEFVELKSGQHTGPRLARNACGVGFLPANGLIYTLPHGCQCYNTIRGTIGLAPAANETDDPVPAKLRLAAGLARLERPTDPRRDENDSPAAEDSQRGWPMFRRDAQRSGATKMPLPAKPEIAWQTKVVSDEDSIPDWLDNPLVSGRITAPVVAGGLAVVAAPDRHQVVAMDAATGKERWRFTAGGRVDTPPTLFAGLCLFGCRDGWVYGLRAADGEAVWQFQAAPHDRRIVAHGQLESLWPVIGSVLVVENRLYAAAGRHSEAEGGIILYALDPWRGDVIWSQTIHELAQHASRGKGIINDLLMSDGASVRLNQRCFALHDGEPLANPKEAEARRRGEAEPASEPRQLLFARGGGVLDRVWASRSAWTDGRSSSPADGQLLVTAATATYGVRIFPGRDGGFVGYGKELKHTPGRYELFAQFYERKGQWTRQLPVQVRALLLADRQLFTAGVQDDVDPPLPRLQVFDALAGKPLATQSLSAAPVHDGFAAADGRLYLSCQDGTLVCFANGKR